jgi:hypothetical protein
MKIIRPRFLFILFLSAPMLGHHAVFGQDPPPPPPPLIYKAPDKSTLKTYVSKDHAFEVVFPGEPTTKKIEAAEFNVFTFETYKDGSRSTIIVYQYNSVMDRNKDALYAVIRQNLLNAPKTTIESEGEIINGDIHGKEFNVLSDYTFRRTRVFANGRLVYIVSCDVTNWHILNSYRKEKVVEFKNESERFMNSFKINK